MKKEEKEDLQELGQEMIHEDDQGNRIQIMSIIGEIEGHELSNQNTKTTKYEHILPELAMLEDNEKVDGILFIVNTVGGDVSCGLALAEMIASLTKPTVTLVIGDSHSIGVPLAVASQYSFIVPSGTVIIHPVRLSGTVIGAPQTYEYFQLIQDRIIHFIATHCDTDEDRLVKMMLTTGILSKDLGTILVGKEAVEAGIINEVGGISDAIAKLKKLICEK